MFITKTPSVRLYLSLTISLTLRPTKKLTRPVGCWKLSLWSLESSARAHDLWYNSQARIYHINHPAHAPLFALISKTKKNCASRFSLIIYTVAPRGSIFSGSAPDQSNFMLKHHDLKDLYRISDSTL